MRFCSALAALLIGLARAGRASAGPALLFDAGSGMVLYAEDADDQWHPASLTKIMTAYVTFAAIKAGRIGLETKIPCTEAAFQQPPSKVGLPVGAEMSIDLALRALIVKSANDVAVMLAEAVAGSEPSFVDEMNATARRLGMMRTRFVNANGLPAAEQVTTARDLAKLARAIVQDFPEHAHYWSMPEVRIGNIRLRSHNGLLKTFDGADGLKTGFICDSGYNVVASATREGRRLMAVVLGEATGYDRTLRAASLLEYGFQQHGWKALFSSAHVDNMPLAPEAKGITSIRETVISWECGTRRRPARPAVQVRTVRAKAAAARAEAAAKAGTPSGAQGSAPAAKSAAPKASAAAPPSGKAQ